MGDSGICTNIDCKLSLCKIHCKNDSTDAVPQIVTECEKGEKNERSGQKGSEKDKKEQSEEKSVGRTRTLKLVQGKPIL